MALIRKAQQTRQYGYSWINVHSGGLIRLSHKLTLAMMVSHGDYIAFYQDDINQKEWYLKKENDGLKINKANKSYFKVNSSVVCRDIMSSININKYRCPVCNNGDVKDKKNGKIRKCLMCNGTGSILKKVKINVDTNAVEGMFKIIIDSAVDINSLKL